MFVAARNVVGIPSRCRNAPKLMNELVNGLENYLARPDINTSPTGVAIVNLAKRRESVT